MKLAIDYVAIIQKIVFREIIIAVTLCCKTVLSMLYMHVCICLRIVDL